MSNTDTIKKAFPTVKWTGESHRHCSIARTIAYGLGHSKRDIIKAAVDHQWGSQLLALLVKMFPGMEWLVSKEEFDALFVQDLHNWLSGGRSGHTDKMLKNPLTGSKYHRMALMKSLVGGVRFWVATSKEDMQGLNVITNPADSQIVGFRFRVECLAESEDNVRGAMRAKAVEAMGVKAKILQDLQIAEPTHVHETTKEKEKVPVLELI